MKKQLLKLKQKLFPSSFFGVYEHRNRTNGKLLRIEVVDLYWYDKTFERKCYASLCYFVNKQTGEIDIDDNATITPEVLLRRIYDEHTMTRVANIR